jgi:hypothetical protein
MRSVISTNVPTARPTVENLLPEGTVMEYIADEGDRPSCGRRCRSIGAATSIAIDKDATVHSPHASLLEMRDIAQQVRKLLERADPGITVTELMPERAADKPNATQMTPEDDSIS